MNFSQIHKIHFIGVGGSGVSGLARIVLELGKNVSGSDLAESQITLDLQRQGARVFIGQHRASNITNEIDLVVYTQATKKGNPEYRNALKKNIPMMTYPEFVAALTERYLTIMVSGTHGKSTITAMVSKIFVEAKTNPSFLIGTNVLEFDGNARLGLGRHFIIEGDEYREAFSHYNPVGLIVNRIEADHLDYYKKLENVITAFKKVISKVPKGGFVIANIMDENVVQALHAAKSRVITYGLGYGDYYATHIEHHGELTRFAVKGLERFDLAIRMPGYHNVQNALAAAVLAIAFGISIEVIQKALLEFSGIERRFEIKGTKKGITVIDDYAHHPTEIKAILQAARDFFPKRRIWCVFQPHSTHRTRSLFQEFISSFQNCDQLIITEIYKVAGREQLDKLSSKKLVEAVAKTRDKVKYKKTLNDATRYVAEHVQRGDVVFTLGAGTITEVSDMLLKKIS